MELDYSINNQESIPGVIDTNILEQICKFSKVNTNISAKQIQKQNEMSKKISSISNLIWENIFDGVEITPVVLEKKKFQCKNNFKDDLIQKEENQVGHEKIQERNKINKILIKEKHLSNLKSYHDLNNFLNSEDFDYKMKNDQEFCQYVINNKFLDLIDKEVRSIYTNILQEAIKNRLKDNRGLKSETFDDDYSLNESGDEGLDDESFGDDDDDGYQAVI